MCVCVCVYIYQVSLKAACTTWFAVSKNNLRSQIGFPFVTCDLINIYVNFGSYFLHL